MVIESELGGYKSGDRETLDESWHGIVVVGVRVREDDSIKVMDTHLPKGLCDRLVTSLWVT